MSFQPDRPQDNPPPLRPRRSLLIVLAVLALLFVITYAGRLGEYRRLLSLEDTMEDRIEEAEARGRQLASDLDYVKSPEYTEKIAITEIGWAQEGDQVLTVIDALAEEEAPQANGADTGGADINEADTGGDSRIVPAPAVPDSEPQVWRQWLSIFRSENE